MSKQNLWKIILQTENMSKDWPKISFCAFEQRESVDIKTQIYRNIFLNISEQSFNVFTQTTMPIFSPTHIDKLTQYVEF